MDFLHLLTGFEGRIGRRPYWIGWIAVAGLSIFLGMISVFIAGLTDAPFTTLKSVPLRVLRVFESLALLVPLAAVFVKRLHDRNKSGYQALLPIGLVALTIAVGGLIELVGIRMADIPLAATMALSAMPVGALIVGAWYIVELGFLRGTRGPNRYGPDPLDDPIATGRRERLAPGPGSTSSRGD